MDSRLFTRSPCLRAPAIRGTVVTEYWIGTAASVCLDARELDHLTPFLGIVSDKPAKVGGRHRHRRAAQVEQPGLHLWIDESAVGFLVELLDDVSWRVLGRTDAVPTARLVARHKLSHGRDVRQRLQARRGGYSERA